MFSFNRGEWSELYGILFLLVHPKLELVDSNLDVINQEIFEIKKIILNSNVLLEYEIDEQKNIIIYANANEYAKYTTDELDKERIVLLNKIQNHVEKTGAFEIPDLEDFVNSITMMSSFKAISNSKADIDTIAFDNNKCKNVNLSYSIKSSLGSPATILNSSKHTDFKYKIKNLPAGLANDINSINTNTKLLDRINFIKSYPNVEINFDSVVSETFDYNLKMIDSKMPEYLGNALLYSYTNNNKDLKTIFRLANPFLSEKMADKKLGDFLNAISFGFIPSKQWDGINSVNGGLIIVKENGNVVVLDLIYFMNEVNEYMINESKLDTPSTTRYHMLEVTEDEDGYSFTLNLQVRYKR